METHAKKRFEIIVELPLQAKITKLLDTQAVHGYTIYTVQGGSGHQGVWQRDGLVGEAGRMIAIVCIVDPSRADELLEAIYAAIERQIGIVSVSDVVVVRSERF